MKLVGIAFFLAVCCICTLGETQTSNSTAKAPSTTLTMPQAAAKAAHTSTSTAPTPKSPVPVTASREARSESPTSNLTLSSVAPNTQQTRQKTTQAATTQPLPETSLAAGDKSNSTANTTFQANETQSTPNGTLGAPSTKGPSLPPTTALQKTTFASETSSLPVNSTAEPTSLSSSGNKLPEDTIHYSSVILPVVISLIVITLSVFSLVALYRMCQKKTPERQENGTEQAQSDKEGVKLLSVKTTSAEAGEHSSQGKNKTRQRDDSSSHVSNKYM